MFCWGLHLGPSGVQRLCLTRKTGRTLQCCYSRLQASGRLAAKPVCRICHQALHMSLHLENAHKPATSLQTRAQQALLTLPSKSARPAPVLVSKSTDISDPGIWHNAAILIDKPLHWTSFDVCGKLRSTLKTKKVGHAGTLDPLAGGLLIVCTGRATKWADSFQALQKEYSGVLRLGEATPSYDCGTPVCEERPFEHITDAQLHEAARGFLGDIMQLPPMYSAIRIKGERLYHAAKRGEQVERVARPVHVSAFDVDRISGGGRDVAYRIVCSKGTYVRSLVHDLGLGLGSCAHVTALRRERIGAHDVADAWDLQELVTQSRASRQQAYSRSIPTGA